MGKKLIVTEPRKVGIVGLELSPPAPGQVLARTVLSGISHGTEMATFLGTTPFRHRRLTEQRVFAPVDPDWQLYPAQFLGYDAVGIVERVGDQVENYKLGQRVWCASNHQTHFVFGADSPEVFPLAQAVRDEHAILLNLAAVAMTAIHDAQVKLGDTVAVFGGGAVGQLAAQLAVLDGASRVFLVEPSAPRRDFAAAKNPAVETIDPTTEPAALQIKQRNADAPPDVVIECSGHLKALQDAIAAAGIAGTVIAAGFYAGQAQGLRLDEEFLHNRVTVKASMAVWGCPSRFADRWDRTRVLRVALRLIELGKLNLDGFVSARFPFEQAQQAYDAIENDPGKHLKVVLTY